MNARLVLALVAIPLLMVSSVSAATTSQPLSLSVSGTIYSSGNQHYVLNQAGPIVYGSILGNELDPSTSWIHYSLVADVVGLTTSGHAEVHLTALTTGGQPLLLDGRVTISDMVPGEPFADSAIPSAFIGLLTGTLSIGGSSQPVALPVSLESPFINPFGNPIVLATADDPSSIVLATGYSVAQLQYNDVQLLSVLPVGGTVGSDPVTGGTAYLTTRALENLYAGTESESGTIAFVGMSPSYLDSSGHYSGSSVIPNESQCMSTYGFEPCTFDCTAFLPLLMGIPTLDLSQAPSGLCTLTGFISSGSFNAVGSHVTIKGSYTTVWDIPAVTFGIAIPPPYGGASITGMVSTH